MGAVVKDKGAMIAGMDPILDPEIYVFAMLTAPLPDRITPMATIQEAEGLSVIVTKAEAAALGYDISHPMQRITLSVYSALDGVGLTAAVAQTLADENIACNMVAGFHHDHAFVPAGDAVRAVDLLEERARAQGESP